MAEASYDLVAIGNALVDVLSHAEDAFIEEQDKEHGMKKGGMMLIDEARAVGLYADMAAGVESSGGSAGNTIAGFASFGGNGAYIGKIADDQLGAVFKHDLKSMGVHFDTQPLVIGAPTGRCLILVTPDAQRTMNTFLGAAVELGPEDIDEELIAGAKVTYLEGYLFDPPHAKEAFRKAGTIAAAAGRKVSLTLSDPFCVDRHREDFQELVEHHIDILFANEEEIKSLCEVETFEEAAQIVAGKCEIAALTRSEKGSVIVAGGEIIEVPPGKPEHVLDSTGAGDQYAAGFLYGYTQGMELAECGRLGTIAATEVIQHMGPRPETAYKELMEKAA